MSVRRGRAWVAHPVRERDGRMGGRVRRIPNRIIRKWQRDEATRFRRFWAPTDAPGNVISVPSWGTEVLWLDRTP